MNLVHNDLRIQYNIKIATYELSYGQGKVAMMDLYGQNLANSKNILEVP